MASSPRGHEQFSGGPKVSASHRSIASAASSASSDSEPACEAAPGTIASSSGTTTFRSRARSRRGSKLLGSTIGSRPSWSTNADSEAFETRRSGRTSTSPSPSERRAGMLRNDSNPRPRPRPIRIDSSRSSAWWAVTIAAHPRRRAICSSASYRARLARSETLPGPRQSTRTTSHSRPAAFACCSTNLASCIDP